MTTQFASAQTIENEGTDELVLVVEPWAREYLLPPGAVYAVRARSGVPGALELEHEGGRLICWAWPGATVEVWSGDRLVDSLDEPVPEVPKGMSVRDFLGKMLGREEPGIDPIREYNEWAQHRYDPGHYLGGTLEPHLRTSALGPKARKNASLFLALAAVMTCGLAIAYWPTQGALERAGSVALATLTSAAAWKMYRAAARD